MDSRRVGRRSAGRGATYARVASNGAVRPLLLLHHQLDGMENGGARGDRPRRPYL